MEYRICYKQSVAKDLLHISKVEKKRILDKIEKNLTVRATEYPMLKGNFAGLRKLRVGDYRVIFAILENEVLILRIGHRREIYER